LGLASMAAARVNPKSLVEGMIFSKPKGITEFSLRVNPAFSNVERQTR